MCPTNTEPTSSFAHIPFGVSFSGGLVPEKFPLGTPLRYIKTSVAFLLAWSLERGHLQLEKAPLKPLTSQLLNKVQVEQKDVIALLEAIEDIFLSEYLRPEARNFLLSYYWPGWHTRYDVDFDKVFVRIYKDALFVKPGYPNRWMVTPSWSEFEKLAPIIDRRWQEWTTQHGLTG